MVLKGLVRMLSGFPVVAEFCDAAGIAGRLDSMARGW